MKYTLFFALAVLGLAGCDKANNPETPLLPVDLQDSVLVDNLAHPWEILWGPDQAIWMTERGGRISRVDPESGSVTRLLTVPDVQSNGEGGLLGMVLHPQFATTPYVYIGYNYNTGSGYREKIVRYTYNGSTLADPVILLDNIAAANIHNGCRLLILQDKLYITTGDAANQPLAQAPSSPNGKVLRLNLDGSIPADNPLPNNPLWTLGHRNPQGLTLVGNRLFISEHGPDSDDEVSILEKGRNYGWPTVRGFCNTADEQAFCTANNVVEPIEAWTPTIAACGMEYYQSDYIPQWKNSLLLATLKNSRLYQLQLNEARTEVTATAEFFTNRYGRLRDVCIAPDGKVYFCTSNGNNDKIVVVTRK